MSQPWAGWDRRNLQLHVSVIPELGMLRQEDESVRPVWAYIVRHNRAPHPHLRQNEQKKFLFSTSPVENSPCHLQSKTESLAAIKALQILSVCLSGFVSCGVHLTFSLHPINVNFLRTLLLRCQNLRSVEDALMKVCRSAVEPRGGVPLACTLREQCL